MNINMNTWNNMGKEGSEAFRNSITFDKKRKM